MTRPFGRAFVAAALILPAACSLLTGPSEPQGRLDENRRKWRAQGILSYTYEHERTCFCPPEITEPVHLTVREGVVVSAVRRDGTLVESARLPQYPTMEGVFEIIQDAIERDAAKIVVAYHPLRGYPTDAEIDYVERAVDEELRLQQRDLVPIP